MNEFFIFNFLFILFLTVFLFIFLTNSPFVLMVFSSLFSIINVLIYSFLKATDVAITEMAISSISTIIFTFSILYINNQKRIKKNFIDNNANIKFQRKLILIVSLVILAYLMYIFFDYIPINTIENQSKDNINALYIKNSIQEFHIPSIVTSIIVGYRALDTMLESVIVLFGSLAFYNILNDKLE